MIIYLTDELIQKCNLNANTPTHLDFFEKLAYNRQRGKYFLLGTRNILKYLSQNTRLNETAKSVFRNILSNFPIESSILQTINFKITIGTSNSYSNNEIMLDIDNLSEDSLDQYNNLLLENSTDSFIYEKITTFYKKEIGQSSLDFKWDIRNGGGTDIKVQFDELIQRNNIYTFCIIDSDKVAQSAPLGATSAKFNSNTDNTIWGSFHIIDVHEIENLIPKKVYIDYINSKNDTNLNMNLEILEGESSLINFLDLKKGLTKRKINLFSPDIKQLYINEFGIDANILACTCSNGCNCHIFHNFGRTILKDIKNFIESNNIDIFEVITDSLKSIFFTIGQLLLNIFCIPQRKFIL